MEKEKIIIAGGTGFIGQEIANYFGKENEIVILTRKLAHQKTNTFGKNSITPEALKNTRFIKWDAKTTGDWVKELEGATLIINLAGKTVNCRYTAKNKQEIFDSRTNATKIIGQAIHNAVQPPKLWINAASATIYPNATDIPRDESFTNFANDFSVQVCKLWEQIFYEQRTPFTRKVALRMAITLGAGGVMTPYFNLLKFGLGGKQGSGKQMYSWVHITDTCRMIEWLMEHKELEGTYNCVSPNAVTNTAFMQTLRKLTGHVIGLPAYKWMLAIGARLIGTEPELVLKSRWVLPAKITQAGFNFKYPLLEDAFKEILTKTPKKKYHLF
jgi:uncharacterized protein (TIGR01777 family)